MLAEPTTLTYNREQVKTVLIEEGITIGDDILDSWFGNNVTLSKEDFEAAHAQGLDDNFQVKKINQTTPAFAWGLGGGVGGIVAVAGALTGALIGSPPFLP